MSRNQELDRSFSNLIWSIFLNVKGEEEHIDLVTEVTFKTLALHKALKKKMSGKPPTTDNTAQTSCGKFHLQQK